MNDLQEQRSDDQSPMEEKPMPQEQQAYPDELSMSDPRLPQNWSLLSKIATSAAAWGYTFTLLISLTCFAAAVPSFLKAFPGVSQERATLGFSLFLWGIMFAPLYTPHISERVGRNPVYIAATLCMSAFLLGAAYSTTFTAFAVCRFFAGLFGGPIVVNVEGTFADLWDARWTVTYYSFLAGAQYLGASVGPVICGGVVAETSWQWSQYVPLMFCLASLVLGFGIPETYPRQIMRNVARKAGHKAVLSPALSGEGIAQMARYTIVDPAIMLVSEPIVMGSTLLVGVSFGVVFGLFTTVPTVLTMLYHLTPHVLGLGFLAGVAGSVMAVLTSIGLETIARPIHERRVGTMTRGVVAVEHRLATAFVGACLMLAGLWWIGNTASPMEQPIVPITGTAFYVWGSMMVIIGIVGYFFDTYPTPHAILSALTAMAVGRLFCGGIVSLFFLSGVMNITGQWMFQIFGIIMCFLIFWPLVLIFIGPVLRSKSRFSRDKTAMSPMLMEASEHKDGSKKHGSAV